MKKKSKFRHMFPAGSRSLLGILLCLLNCCHHFCVISSFSLSGRAAFLGRTTPTTPRSLCRLMASSNTDRCLGEPHVENVLFIECGFGNDSHGQNATKAAVRACRNAIEFNSIPSINRLVPQGYDGLKLDVLLAIPSKYKDSLDLSQVQQVFPYGSIRFQLQDGGMIAPSGIAIDRLGDKNDDMVVVCCSVTVGY